MWIYVDINTWCVVFHIDEHVMCGLSYWWTRACVSFVLALCCNALAFSRNEISKFSKLIFWILLVVYNIKWLISTTCQVVGYFFISISDKVLWLIKLIWVLGLKIIWLLVPSSQFEVCSIWQSLHGYQEFKKISKIAVFPFHIYNWTYMPIKILPPYINFDFKN